jgi:hypothetical protein
MQHGLDVKTCTWARSIDMENGHAAWTSHMEKQQVHADTLLKTLAFPPAAWIWALQPSFQCGRGSAREEKAQIRARHYLFFSRTALSLFSRSFFLALSRSFLLCAQERKKKSERPPLHKLNMASNYPKLFEFEAHFAVFAPLLDSVKTVSASTIDAFLRRTLRCLLSSLAESNTEIVPLSKGILDQNSHVGINSPSVSLH